MGSRVRISGKNRELPELESGWKWEPRPGNWWMVTRVSEGRTERVRIRVARRGGEVSVHVHGRTFRAEKIETPLGETDGLADDSALVAQFPGKIRKILVQAGDRVKKGDSLLMVEAMKMEFAVQAPFDARVVQIRVEAGAQIAPGTRYLDLEKGET